MKTLFKLIILALLLWGAYTIGHLRGEASVEVNAANVAEKMNEDLKEQIGVDVKSVIIKESEKSDSTQVESKIQED